MKDKWMLFAIILYLTNIFGWLVFVILKIARGEA
jgi:uncharacterized membrane protein